MPKHMCCNLGSLNLSEFIINPYTKIAKFDFKSFEKAVHIAVQGLDNIIDENINRHALKIQADNSKNYRNIGLGVMGYGTALFKLGIKYGSDEALFFTNEIFKTMLTQALIASNKLAQEKGAFEKCKPEVIVESNIIKNLYNSSNDKKCIEALIDNIRTYGLRNCSLLSVAPNGSIATLLNITGGCEPEFALSYTRRTDNLKESYEVYSSAVKEYWDATNDTVDKGNINNLPNYFITSAQIPWRERIDTQAIMQKYVDTAISSTVNLDKNIPIEEVEQIYLYAWSKGLKGITIYRSGCKREGILVLDSTPKEEEVKTLGRGQVVQANDNAIGKKRRITTGCGSLHCTAFFDPDTGNLLETYLSKGSTGGCSNYMVGLSRMISLAARGGISIEAIIDQLNSCGVCPSYAVRRATKKDTSKGSCCPMAIGYALREMYDEMNNDKHLDLQEESKVKKYECPQCGEDLIFEGGCNVCKSCGWSKCD